MVEDQQRAHCCHHWIIETPSGPISKSVCQLCGEERQFQNAPQLDTWAQDQARRRQDNREDSKEQQP